jgi:Chaperone of endosialidase
MNPLIQSKDTTILPVLIALTLGCFGLSPQARAVCQQGCFADQNTALGDDALFGITTGVFNTAIGFNALFFNSTGFNNTAVGSDALQGNTTGSANTATGVAALHNNTTGTVNTAIGVAALDRNTIGSNNIAVGAGAGGSLNTGDNNIDIGNPGADREANTIRIGTQGIQTATFVAGVNGGAVIGQAVKANDAGQIGTAPSSKRFKDEITPMDNASEAILALKPVAFRYKKDLDPDRTLQFGLVAEDVEKVSRDLVFRDAEGKVYSVRYEAVNAMLLNEFLKEHRKNDEQEATITRMQKQIETLATGLQKVNAQLEASKPAPQVVINP